MDNKKEELMTFEEALKVVKGLSKSQGFYGRRLNYMKEFTEEQKAEFTKVLEKNNIKTGLDLIFLFEC